MTAEDERLKPDEKKSRRANKMPLCTGTVAIVHVPAFKNSEWAVCADSHPPDFFAASFYALILIK
jgi:hypothetical protein